MLTLINANLMRPPIAPIGLEYVACAAREAGIPVHILDLCLTQAPKAALDLYFHHNDPLLVGLSFRNVDDCFWPSAQWFVPALTDLVLRIRQLSDAPIVLGGVGYSIFPRVLVTHTGADFGVHGDGEHGLIALYREVQGEKRFDAVPGLLWRAQGRLRTNAPAWSGELSVPTTRDQVDNPTYFRTGGQIGLETKRGCPRQCLYCADPLAKGSKIRLRPPALVADEVQTLLAQGIDVLHLCDAEFNIPHSHALAVCQAFIDRGLDQKIRWYAYLSVVPFDRELAGAMQQAGCVGIDFTTDAANPSMLTTYRQPHGKQDIARAVKLCRDHEMAVMTDMLLGGPGETPETLAETIGFMKQIGPDGVGTGLGLRIYPGTGMEQLLHKQGASDANPHIRRKYAGPVDLFKPTFYIARELGENPACLVRDLIDADPRFFAPMEENDLDRQGHGDSRDHNYNENTELTDAIARGERGAYWHILLKLRGLV